MRLRGISTMEAANAYVPVFIDSFNSRFAKPPRNNFDANRPLREDEDIDLILTVREPRRVTYNLTLQYDRTMYLLTDTPAARAVMGKYVEVFDYPDGRIEVRAHGAALAYITYDRLSEIDQGAAVENKRLGHALQAAQIVQELRDNRRSGPARTSQTGKVISKKRMPNKKAQRAIDATDLANALAQANQLRLASAI